MKSKKLLLLMVMLVSAVLILAACGGTSGKIIEDGRKLFVSTDGRYQVITPADWKKDSNTVINGAIIAVTKDAETQSLMVFSEKKEDSANVLLKGYSDDIVQTIEDSTDDFTIISQENIELDDKPVVATKIRHKVADKDTISWVYIMDAGDEFLRIVAFTYQPDVLENSQIIEDVLLTFEEVK